jgi:hypothetical protein
MAITTNGATFTYDTEVIGEVISISGPSVSINTIDTTTLDDIHRTFVGGTIDSGELSLEVLIDPMGTDAQKFEDEWDATATAAPTAKACIITFPSAATAATYTFNAVLTGFELSLPIDDSIKANITLKISGSVTIA